MPNEFSKPVFQHNFTSLVATAITHWLTSTTPKRRDTLGVLGRGALLCLIVTISSGLGYNQTAAAVRMTVRSTATTDQVATYWLVFIARPVRPYRHLDRPRATSVHVERSCAALDNLLRDHDLLDALEAW